MIEVLNESFLPKDILFRDEQLNKIKQVFENFKKINCGVNILLTGVTGSGKTTIIKKIVEEYNDCYYINGNDTRTPVNSLKSLFNIKEQSHGDVLKEAFEILKKKRKMIIIDEIDKIKNYNEFVNDLNTLYRKFTMPIIIITCKRNFVETIPVDAKKTLWFDRISLPAYNSIELKEIVKSRLKLMNIDIPDLNEHFISKLSAYGARSGSCRITFNILLRCLQKNSFKISDLDEINKSLNDIDWRGFYDDLNDTEKKFLSALCSCCNNLEECSSFNVSEQLSKFWSVKLTSARISQLINFFMDYDIIISRHENKGRSGGRQRLIKFKSDEIYNSIKSIVPY